MQRCALIRHVERHGCVFVRAGGRHTIYVNPTNGNTAAIPRHRELANRLARVICQQLEIPEP